ncbi:hypothetical protein ACN47E_006588 [Coniothyrium glycines]
MQFKNIAVVAAVLASSALAEFVVITQIPTPTDLSALTNPESFISSLENFVTSKIGEFAADSSAVSAASSARAVLGSFVATATYSIPPGVTQLTAIETYTTVPDWYTALPSDIKSYYDQQNALYQSLLNEAILGPNATTTSGLSGSATRSASGASTSQTGAAPDKAIAMVGAGFAAVFAGVLAL